MAPLDQVVLCCGANRAAPLMAPVDREMRELLGSIPHTGSAIWTFGYRTEDVPHPLDAFGFLVPKRERETIRRAPGWRRSGRGACPRVSCAAVFFDQSRGQ